MSSSNYRTNYKSCFRLNGRPILPPVITPETAQEIERLRQAAIEIETRRKEQKRAALLEKVNQILERCTTPANLETIELTKYKVINIPSLNARVNHSLCLEDDEKTEESRKTVSLPTTPISERSAAELQEGFKNLMPSNTEREQQTSECSTLSTDLGQYMVVSQTSKSTTSDSCENLTDNGSDSDEEATPVASSDSEREETTESSTPVNSHRIRRLSYTLEAPSPVLLELMGKNKSVSNNNNAEKEVKRSQDEVNGNNHKPNTNLVQDFITKQQQMMQQLLERQQREQQELEELFRQQEEELLRQLQQSSSSSFNLPKPGSSCSRRSLTAAFEALPAGNFSRLPALVRGYLTRRLLQTDRVKNIVKTIKDTIQCLQDLRQGGTAIMPSDIDLHKRLVQQLNGAVEAFHDTFFGISIRERMEIISHDRLKKLQVYPTAPRQRSRSLSSATLKSLERKMGSRPGSAATISSSVSNGTQRSRKSASSVTSISTTLANYSNGLNAVRKIALRSNGRKPWR